MLRLRMANITLPADLEAWARNEVAAGRAQSVDTLVAQALHERRLLSDAHRGAVEKAYASVARGAVMSEIEVDAELDRWIAEDRATG